MANTIAVVNSAKATSAFFDASSGCMTAIKIVADMRMARMPTPEMGLFEAPIRPAM